MHNKGIFPSCHHFLETITQQKRAWSYSCKIAESMLDVCALNLQYNGFFDSSDCQPSVFQGTCQDRSQGMKNPLIPCLIHCDPWADLSKPAAHFQTLGYQIHPTNCQYIIYFDFIFGIQHPSVSRLPSLMLSLILSGPSSVCDSLSKSRTLYYYYINGSYIPLTFFF